MKTLPEYSVRDLMQKNITFIKETATLTEAVKVMAQKKVTSLIVEKEHPQDAYGILTRKDLIIELSENWDSLKTLKVSDLATKPVISIEAGVGVKHAARLMRLAGVRRLVVYEADKLVGVISNADLFDVVLKSV